MNIEKFKDFVKELKQKTPLFIKNMEIKDVKGKYKMSLAGDIPSSKIDWGLGQSTFASRILYILDSLDIDTNKNITHFINTFANKDGSYNDKYVSSSTFILRTLISIKYRNSEAFLNKINKRAETRQAKASLINMNANSLEYTGLNLKNLDIDKYFNQFNWCKPWGAASHINHLLFFTKYSTELNDKEKGTIYKKVEENLSQYLQKDGFYKNGCSLNNNQKIGGLMKFLMGLSQADLDKKYVSKGFIDFALDEMVSCNACENFNTLYTLYY